MQQYARIFSELSETRPKTFLCIPSILPVKRNIKGNLLKLTAKGYKKLKETLPTWRESNTKGKILISNYIDVLKKISK